MAGANFKEKEETKDKPPHYRSHTSPQQEEDAVMIPIMWWKEIFFLRETPRPLSNTFGF